MQFQTCDPLDGNLRASRNTGGLVGNQQTAVLAYDGKNMDGIFVDS